VDAQFSEEADEKIIYLPVFTRMNINIKITGLDISTAVSEYVNKRLEKISKLLNDDSAIQCDIELARTSEHHHKGDVFRAEIHIVGSGKNVYASSEREDLYSAIDDTRDEILRVLKANKSKRISLIRKSGAKVKDMIKGLWSWKK